MVLWPLYLCVPLARVPVTKLDEHDSMTHDSVEIDFYQLYLVPGTEYGRHLYPRCREVRINHAVACIANKGTIYCDKLSFS